MSSKVISFVIDDVEKPLDSVLAAAINEFHNTGRVIREIRVMDDSGEVRVPANTVAGVTVPEPVTPPSETSPTVAPAVDVPVDPTPAATVTPSDTPSA